MGHTAGIARQIQVQTGGTLFEIKPAEPYSDDYDTTERQGRKETQSGYRPPLADMPAELDSYDMILLGTPNWFNTIARPVASFLASSNLSGKKIGLFFSAPMEAAEWDISLPTSRLFAKIRKSWTASISMRMAVQELKRRLQTG